MTRWPTISSTSTSSTTCSAATAGLSPSPAAERPMAGRWLPSTSAASTALISRRWLQSRSTAGACRLSRPPGARALSAEPALLGAAEHVRQGRAERCRAVGNGDAGGLHGLDLVLGLALAAGD